MKSDQPYLGVRMPDLRRAWRSVLAAGPIEGRSELEAAVSELWDGAAFREERYTAIALLDRDFFVRKAIGWALRDYAWHDPVEVDRYVREHEARLSGLSRREATKNLARLLS